MKCRECGKELEIGEQRCSFCGAPVRRRKKTAQHGSGGFGVLVGILVVMILLCAGACYMLLTRGPDFATWFSAAAPSPTVEPEPTAEPAGAANAGGGQAGSPLFPGMGMPNGGTLLPDGDPGSSLLLQTALPELTGGLYPANPATVEPAATSVAATATPKPAVTAKPTATTATPAATAKPAATPTATVKPTATPAPDAAVQHDFLEGLILTGFERKLTNDELKDLTKYELQVVRNGMYALSGLKFPKNKDLRTFYEQCSWYDPNETSAETVYKRFNEFQTANVAAIVKVEKDKGYR